MKRLLLTGACLSLLISADLGAAVVAGKVTFLTKRGQNPVPNETLVWLEPAGTTKASRRPPGKFQMVTRSKTISPHVLAVPPGSMVDFPNEDPIAHNLFSLSQGNAFDLGLYRKGAGRSRKFDNPGVVNVYCNVHPNMSAVVHVVPSAYYAFADASGAYSLADVVPGKYRLNAWNEQGGTTATDIEVSAAGAVSGNVELTLDSRNFRASQHLNKTGKPYQKPSSKEY